MNKSNKRKKKTKIKQKHQQTTNIKKKLTKIPKKYIYLLLNKCVTYSKQNKKKGTMRKEKPKNQTQKQFVLIFATATEQQTTHHT